jgi:hypothetical protein
VFGEVVHRQGGGGSEVVNARIGFIADMDQHMSGGVDIDAAAAIIASDKKGCVRMELRHIGSFCRQRMLRYYYLLCLAAMVPTRMPATSSSSLHEIRHGGSMEEVLMLPPNTSRQIFFLPPKITATCPIESLFFMSISRQTAALPPTKNESLFHLHIPSKSGQLLFSTESRMQ